MSGGLVIGKEGSQKLCSREGKTMNDNFHSGGTRALVYLGNHRIVPGNLSATTKFSQLHPRVQCPFFIICIRKKKKSQKPIYYMSEGL